jgi:hypothetical protein
MNNFRQQLRSLSVLQQLSSIKITVLCLGWLFVLVFWGTIAQVEYGLYLAQKKFFYSWFFTTLGFIPLPGAQLTLWVLFVNLAAVSITRFAYHWNRIGILIIHIGLLTYFVAAFVTFHVTEESNVTVMEGDATNVSSSYHDWEISIWEESQDTKKKNILAVDLGRIGENKKFSVPGLNLTIQVQKYYPNADAYTAGDVHSAAYQNDSGIESIGAKPLEKEPEKNIPGGIIVVSDPAGNARAILLYGAETTPTKVNISGKEYNFLLRRQRSQLPFLITLKDFTAQFHPGTEVASKYQSLVEIEHDGLKREVLIYMNEPLRFREYAFYQASYSIDSMGREFSTLAVVRNHGRMLPYIASMLTAFGLALHFLLQGFANARKK